MKYIFFLIYLLSSFVTQPLICDSSNLEFDVPKDLKIINTWDRNGVLTVIDEEGNGADVYIVKSSEIYPYNKVIRIPKKDFVLEVYFFEQSNPQAYKKFEEEVTNMLQQETKGESNEKAWRNCIRDYFNRIRIFER